MSNSFKGEVIADDSGKWVSNGLRFATYAEADCYVVDLSIRWTLVRECRVVESDEPVNYVWRNGKAINLEQWRTS